MPVLQFWTAHSRSEMLLLLRSVLCTWFNAIVVIVCYGTCHYALVFMYSLFHSGTSYVTIIIAVVCDFEQICVLCCTAARNIPLTFSACEITTDLFQARAIQSEIGLLTAVDHF